MSHHSRAPAFPRAVCVPGGRTERTVQCQGDQLLCVRDRGAQRGLVFPPQLYVSALC